MNLGRKADTSQLEHSVHHALHGSFQDRYDDMLDYLSLSNSAYSGLPVLARFPSECSISSLSSISDMGLEETRSVITSEWRNGTLEDSLLLTFDACWDRWYTKLEGSFNEPRSIWALADDPGSPSAPRSHQQALVLHAFGAAGKKSSLFRRPTHPDA